MMRLVMAAVFTCAIAASAAADVTVKSTTKGPMGDTPSVQYIKGTKARVETSVMGRQSIMIIDAAARQMITLDPATRQATIFDMSKLAEQMQQTAKPTDVKLSMTPTGRTKTLLGRQCTEYNLSMTFTVTPPGMQGAQPMTVTLAGPTWIAKDAPGTKDFETFYKAASEGGLFAGGGAPAGRGTARGNLGMNERSMQAMYKALAEAGGIPYEQTLEMKMEGGGPMADMMRGRGGMPATTTTVTGVSTDPIPDSMFQVPAGYTTRKQ